MSSPADLVVSPQPTAEKGWLWRRGFTFLFGLLFTALLGLIVWRLSEPKALRDVALMLTGLIGLLQLFYLGGATLTDIWRLVSAVKTTRIVNERLGGGPAS